MATDMDRADIGAPELNPDFAQTQAQAAAAQGLTTAPVVIDDPVVPVAKGGTGANTAAGARTNLGVPGLPVGIAEGGTGATTAADALTNLGVPKNNYAATVPPTVNEDSGDGYSVGSNWYDTTADDAWVCLDATPGAAVWKKTTP